MKKVSLSLDDALYEELRRRAFREHTTVEELLRRAVGLVYTNKPAEPPPSSPQRPAPSKTRPVAPVPTRPLRSQTSQSSPRQSSPVPPAREPVTDELYIRRLPMDEALFRLDAYLDAAFMAGYVTVRIVHGKGGGILKGAVWQRLKGHPLVHSYRLAEIGEGDAGVTVAELVRK